MRRAVPMQLRIPRNANNPQLGEAVAAVIGVIIHVTEGKIRLGQSQTGVCRILTFIHLQPVWRGCRRVIHAKGKKGSFNGALMTIRVGDDEIEHIPPHRTVIVRMGSIILPIPALVIGMIILCEIPERRLGVIQRGLLRRGQIARTAAVTGHDIEIVICAGRPAGRRSCRAGGIGNPACPQIAEFPDYDESVLPEFRKILTVVTPAIVIIRNISRVLADRGRRRAVTGFVVDILRLHPDIQVAAVILRVRVGRGENTANRCARLGGIVRRCCFSRLKNMLALDFLVAAAGVVRLRGDGDGETADLRLAAMLVDKTEADSDRIGRVPSGLDGMRCQLGKRDHCARRLLPLEGSIHHFGDDHPGKAVAAGVRIVVHIGEERPEPCLVQRLGDILVRRLLGNPTRQRGIIIHAADVHADMYFAAVAVRIGRYAPVGHGKGEDVTLQAVRIRRVIFRNVGKGPFDRIHIPAQLQRVVTDMRRSEIGMEPCPRPVAISGVVGPPLNLQISVFAFHEIGFCRHEPVKRIVLVIQRVGPRRARGFVPRRILLIAQHKDRVAQCDLGRVGGRSRPDLQPQIGSLVLLRVGRHKALDVGLELARRRLPRCQFRRHGKRDHRIRLLRNLI